MTCRDVFIGMGSNLGNRREHMIESARRLQQISGCRDWRFSALYCSSPVDCREPLEFLNAVAGCRSDLKPVALLEQLLAIEDSFGRQRPYANAPRPIDLDLLLFGSRVQNTPRLTLPHPRMHQRLFVLIPLGELSPHTLHPIENRPIEQLLEQVPSGETDSARVTKSSQPWPLDLF